MYPSVSVIIRGYNREQYIGQAIESVLAQTYTDFDLLVWDDGSTDKTAEILAGLRSRHPVLRIVAIAPASGQSAAFGAAFRQCRGQVVALMDGDGQNDPHDIPMLLATLERCDACCGYRALRRDTVSKRIGSRLANFVRRSILNDGIRDTGCTLKAIKREFVMNLPMQWRGMHRFLPALLLMQGARITQVPVNHRLRAAGRSKYTNLGRLLETVWDVGAVRWMQKRFRRYRVANGGSMQ